MRTEKETVIYAENGDKIRIECGAVTIRVGDSVYIRLADGPDTLVNIQGGDTTISVHRDLDASDGIIIEADNDWHEVEVSPADKERADYRQRLAVGDNIFVRFNAQQSPIPIPDNMRASAVVPAMDNL